VQGPSLALRRSALAAFADPAIQVRLLDETFEKSKEFPVGLVRVCSDHEPCLRILLPVLLELL
jgi:hypothetical protein